MKPTAYIFDVDGTLVNTSSIIHHVLKRPKNVEEFNKAALHAPAHDHVIEMAVKASIKGHRIVIVTARHQRWKMQTELWLTKFMVPYDHVYMRANDDHRPDYDVKKDILKLINEDYFVVHAVDDNPDIIRLWEENGIPTTTVEGWVG